MQQQLLFQSKPRTHGRTQPELSPRLPERPGPDPAAEWTLLHRIIPICGCWLYMRLGQNQPNLNHLNLDLNVDLNLDLDQQLGVETNFRNTNI